MESSIHIDKLEVEPAAVMVVGCVLRFIVNVALQRKPNVTTYPFVFPNMHLTFPETLCGRPVLVLAAIQTLCALVSGVSHTYPIDLGTMRLCITYSCAQIHCSMQPTNRLNLSGS